MNPLPAAIGGVNPIKLEAGEKVPEAIVAESTTDNVTLDKESYEKSDRLPGLETELPPVSKNLIPESSLPIADPNDVTINTVTADSTTAALAGQVPLEKTEKAEKPTADELDKEVSVNPLPAAIGGVNPIKLEAGEKIPEAIVAESTTDNVTLDKESYEKSDRLPGLETELPPVTKNLIPESSLPIADSNDVTINTVTADSTTAALAGQVPLESTAKTEQPAPAPEAAVDELDKEVSVNPLPAAIGGVNPIKLEAGEKIPEAIIAESTTDNVTLDKESYEKSDRLPGLETELPPVSKNMIPESSLPIVGPNDATINTVTADSTTAALAAEVPLEETKAAEPTPEHVAEPTFEAAKEEPVVEEAAPEPVVEAAPEPVVEAAKEEPVVEAAPEPVPEPIVEEAAPEPIVEAAPEPTTEPVVEEAAPEPIVEAAKEEPVVEAAPEPIVEAAPEPVPEPAAETAKEELAVEAPPEPVAEPAIETAKEEAVVEAPAAEPVAEPTPEPVAEEAAKPEANGDEAIPADGSETTAAATPAEPAESTTPSTTAKKPVDTSTPVEKKKKSRLSAFFSKLKPRKDKA